MAPRLLITGASGFLGKQLLAFLTDYDVHAVTRKSTRSVTEGAEWHACDLMDSAARRSLIKTIRPSHLVHLAWVTEQGRYWSSADNLNWIAASLMLLREFAEAGGQRVVMAGTCAEYDWAQKSPFSESSATGPKTLYGAAKLATGGAATGFAETTSISLGWARLFYLYGPNEHMERLVPSLVRSALRGEIPTPRTPNDIVDLMYVTDAAAALAALLTSDVEGPINVCSGGPIRISALASQIAEQVGTDMPIVHPGAPGQTVVGDPTRLRVEVGYEGGRELSAGLGEAIEWWRSLV